MSEHGNNDSSSSNGAAATSSCINNNNNKNEPPPPAAAPSQPPPRFRTAADYENESTLRSALIEPPFVVHRRPVTPNDTNTTNDEQEVIQTIGPCVMDANNLVASNASNNLCGCDWQTAKLDLSTSHPQSMEGEVRRLMELKKYAILDSEQEPKFERITALASRIFDVPICLVSLVDVGRQWFMSNRGLGEVRETSREVSFCAHAIYAKQDVFIVPDTYEDPRFKENGLVTGAPFIRFYAGVPLVTPGGYKLGTFCIIDRKPRANGLGLSEKQNLRELTEMVMDTMVHRKQEMERLMDEKTRLIACAAHDLLSPLTGIQLNLGLLMEDETLAEKLDDYQKELMDASVKCSDMIERICVQAIESFRGDLTRAHSPEEEDDDASGEEGLVNVDQLMGNIDKVVGTLPKKVSFFVEKDENVPRTIISDDLKLFRSSLNYVTNACKHTESGSIRLRTYVRKASDSATDMELDLLPGALVTPKRDAFIVEVHDTGPGIDIEKYPTLFTPITSSISTNNHSKMSNSGLGLYSVATEIGSLGGEYGVFPRQDLLATLPDHDHDSVGLDYPNNENELKINGCVFWFSVPLVLPSTALPVESLSRMDLNIEKDSSSVMSMVPESESVVNKMDDSKLMPAPDAVSPTVSPAKVDMPIKKKRSLNGETVCTGSDTRRPAIKKLALSRSLVKSKENPTNTPASNVYAAIEQQPTKRVKRVLIIDDSLTIRKGLSRGFARLGFEVDEAENGLVGLKMLKAAMYEFVVLDFLMPVIDGPDVARKFRAWEQEYRTDFHQYIIGISAHANGKDAELGIKSGMDRFMGKPVPLKSLKDMAQCKPVIEASILLDLKFKKSYDAIEAASKLAEARSDNDGCSTSSFSSSTSTFVKHTCLIVTKESGVTQESLQRCVEKNGWRAVVVKHGDGKDALRLLKLRNWDTVFIDNDLPILSGMNCIVQFRDWEKRSRSMHQKNIFIISDTHHCPGPSGGFDGTLMKPVEPTQVLQILENASKGIFKFGTTINVR